MTCPQCGLEDQDHDPIVADDGRVKRYCPQPSPVTDTATAIARIRAIKEKLR